jgi:ABC-type lipoprotein export system ATPase subunit
VAEYAAELEDVTVQYATSSGPVAALRGITVRFPTGSSTAVVGRSGSGKSTLVSVLSLLRRPTSGRVRLSGEVASDLGPRALATLRARSIGIAFQAFHLEPALSAVENVMLSWYFHTRQTTRREARSRAVSILERLGIGELADRRPNQMSGGQRQRVAIGRALFGAPTLLVADEPTGSLDEETANSVAETLFSLPAQFGTTVVVVTHDAAVAEMAGTRLTLVRGTLGCDS